MIWLVRWTTGRLLRTPAGRLTHDLNCCCAEGHCEGSPCGPPVTLVVVTSGFAASGLCDCLGFNDTFNAQWSPGQAECQWELRYIYDLTDQMDLDCYFGWDGVAALITGQHTWNEIQSDYSWEAEITFYVFNGTAENPTADYTLGTTGTTLRRFVTCDGDSVVVPQPANEACNITNAEVSFTTAF